MDQLFKIKEHVELLYQNLNIKSHKFSDILIYISFIKIKLNKILSIR